MGYTTVFIQYVTHYN